MEPGVVSVGGAEEPKAAPPRWEWRADWGDAASESESWLAYPEHDSKAIEDGFQSGFSPFPIGTRHVCDFESRTQRRLPDPSRPRASSERERAIRRVPDAPFPAVLVVEVWENETRKPFADFEPSSGGVLDRPHWSDRDGEPRSAPRDDMPTPAGDEWRWVNNSWSVDVYPPVTTREGWQYAGSFAPLALPWAPEPAPLRRVRRRRHVRLQQLGGSGDQPLTMFREFIARSRGSSAALFGVVPAYVAAGAVERASWSTAALSAKRLSAPIPSVQLELEPDPQPEPEPEPEVQSKRGHEPEAQSEPYSSASTITLPQSGATEPEPEAQPLADLKPEPGQKFNPDHELSPGSSPASELTAGHNSHPDRAANPETPHQVLGAPPNFPAPSPPVVEAAALISVDVTEGAAGFVCDDELVVTKVQRHKAAEKAGLQPGMQLQSFQGNEFSGADVNWDSVKRLVQSTPRPWSFSFGAFKAVQEKNAGTPTQSVPARESSLSPLQVLQCDVTTRTSVCSPPEGTCLKQKPTLRTWPTRYIRIQGKSLNVFQSKGDVKTRGSSITDLNGCDVAGGVETWPLRGTWYKMVVFRADLKPPVGPTAAFCFRTEAERNRFMNAVRNLAQGRLWDEDGASDSDHESELSPADAPLPAQLDVVPGQNALARTAVDTRDAMLTEPCPTPTPTTHSMTPLEQQRSSMANNFDLLLRQHQVPDALASAPRDLGPQIRQLYPEISDAMQASEAALAGWVAVVDHILQPWAGDDSQGRMLRELGFLKTGHQLREAFGVSAEEHRLAVNDRVRPRRRASLRALFARQDDEVQGGPPVIESILGPSASECTVHLVEFELPEPVDGSIVVRIEANVGGSADDFSLSSSDSISWLSAPAYAKDGLAKWDVRGGKFRVSGAVSSLRIFVEAATSDGRSITTNRRGVTQVDVVPTDPLGVEPVNLTTQAVAGLENADKEVDVQISKSDGVITCTADSTEEWNRALFKMGLRSIALRDNPNAIVYAHRIEVTFHFKRQQMIVFADATGATYVLRCLSGSIKTLTFNSGDPTITKISVCDIGLQGMKATAAALTSVNSDDLASDSEWFPGKNMLRLAKGASGILGADDLPGAIEFEGGHLKVIIRQWERNLLQDLPTKTLEVELDAAKQAAEQQIKADNRAAATTELERAEYLTQVLSSRNEDLSDDCTLNVDAVENLIDTLQLIVGRTIAYYVERVSQLGPGEDLFSDDDDAEDEWTDGHEADILDDTDEWVGLSKTVSDEFVDKGASCSAEQGSTTFSLRRQLRTNGHMWPLATIVPWRVYYLFNELAIDTNASASVLWLCQVSGMLRKFPSVPSIVYMQALQALWSDCSQHFAVDETEQTRALEQAVVSVTSHCILNSIRNLWQSYPQDNRSTADDHLDALQCGLRILKLLTEQTVNLENPDMSPDEHRSECHRQLTEQIKNAIFEAAQEVGLRLQAVRAGEYFAAYPDEDSDDAEWEKVDDDVQKAAIADERRQKMQELAKNINFVCDAIIKFNNHYAPVFHAELDLPASTMFSSELYQETWRTVRLMQETAEPELHIEYMQTLVISCTRLNRSVAAANCDIELNDVAEAVETFVRATIQHCGQHLSQIADAAIKVDDFKPMNSSQRYSTSVVDVLRACVQAVQPLQYLIWSPSAAVEMTQRLGQVVVWYANLVTTSCMGEAMQLRVAWQEEDGTALSRVPVTAAHVHGGELLCRLFVHMNNMFHAHHELANLGEKIDALHHIVQQEGPDGWHQYVEQNGQFQWDTSVESWPGDRSWVYATDTQHVAEEDAATLRPTMSLLNRGEVKDPASVVDIFLHQCLLKYRECMAEVVDAVALNIHNEIVACTTDASGADRGAQMFEWIDREILTAADETLDPRVFRRFVRGLHFQCFCQLEAILLGDGPESAKDNAIYVAQISSVAELCGATNNFFGGQPLGTAGTRLSERLEALVCIHQNKTSQELRSLSDQTDRKLPEHISPDDIRRIIAMRSSHDAVALGILQEQGLTTASVAPPEGFDIGPDESCLGCFECWFPKGAIYICTHHLLFVPKLSFSGETKLQVRYSEIRFLKKQKMTGVGTDTCLEIGLDQEVICFRGFVAPNATGQSVRDNCHALICQQSAASCGNDLESAEAGSWPELRRMFGIPASESLVETFSCHYVVHGVNETTHTNEGTLYITRTFLCFHSYFFGLRKQEVIPLRDCARIVKSSYPLLVPNAIDVFTTASSELSATRAMNRRTFFGFGFGLDRQTAFDTISKQLLLCRDGASTGSAGGADPAPAVIYVVCVFAQGHLSVPLCCVLTGTQGDSGERSLGPAADKSYALECTDLGELTSLRIWPADEARDDATAMVATYQRTMQGHPAYVSPRLNVDLVVIQTRSIVGGSPVGVPAVFTSMAKAHVRGPLEMTRDNVTETAHHSSRVLEVEEEVFENQRRPAFSFHPEFAAGELTPIERGPWTDEKGRPRIKRNVGLPVGWEWVNDWCIDRSGTGDRCDQDGWRYAFNWPRDLSFVKHYYPSPNKPVRNFVRRRRWVRLRRLDAMAGLASSEPEPEPEPEPERGLPKS